MKRRTFLKKSAPWLSLPLLLNAMPVFAAKPQKYLQRLNRLALEEDRVLVLIQLNGGNDGLNTVIPLDQYSFYRNARTNIAIPENQVLSLNGATGLHPAMEGVHQLYQEGLVGVLQNVGYPSPNFSHFRATDIWTSASSSDEFVNSGWIGRLLEQYHPDFPEGYPNAEFTDPLAITVGSVVSQTCQGTMSNMGLAVSNDNFSYDYDGSGSDGMEGWEYTHELDFVRSMMRQTNAYAGVIQGAFDKADNLYDSYPQTPLAEQLKIVARLVHGGLQTRIFVVNIGGFDTHANQAVAGNTSTGQHATLLQNLSDSVTAFMRDLKLMGKQEQVLALTFSEFGRRIRSNNSGGTDHGAAAPMFVFGTEVNPIIHGPNPAIPSNPAQNESLPMQFDFRDVYATLVTDWLGADESLAHEIFFRNHEHLPIIGRITSLEPSNPLGIHLGQNYPNPAQGHTTIPLMLPVDQRVDIRLFTSNGQEARVIYKGKLNKGRHDILVDVTSLKPGVYLYGSPALGKESTKKLIIR
jgi:uncharacterized protein (DUF1501 family)